VVVVVVVVMELDSFLTLSKQYSKTLHPWNKPISEVFSFQGAKGTEKSSVGRKCVLT
jgi:hypothetical protein